MEKPARVRLGKVEKDDPLWKLLRKWFITADANMVPLEKLALESGGVEYL